MTSTTPLNKIVDSVIKTIKASSIASELFDSVAEDYSIYNEHLNKQLILRSKTIGVFHACQYQSEKDHRQVGQHQSYKGLIYIDCYLDKLDPIKPQALKMVDEFFWEVYTALLADKSLNKTCNEFVIAGQPFFSSLENQKKTEVFNLDKMTSILMTRPLLTRFKVYEGH